MMDRKNENGTERINRIRDRRKAKEAKSAEPVRLLTIRHPGDQNDMDNPGRKRKKFNTRWVSGIMALLFAAAIGCYAFLPMFRFDDIVILGLEKISQDEIVYFTGAKGKPVFTINPDRVRSTLLTHYHDVYDAEVKIDFPAEMVIDLKERVPVVEWDFGGSRFWIDKEGVVLNDESTHEDIIHVYADSYPGAISQEDRSIPTYFSKDVLQTILTMGKYAPEDKPLYFTYKNGYGWDTEEGWRIFFGKTDADIEEKLRMQESLTAYFIKNEIKPIFVSLEFKDAPYYRFVEN